MCAKQSLLKPADESSVDVTDLTRALYRTGVLGGDEQHEARCREYAGRNALSVKGLSSVRQGL